MKTYAEYLKSLGATDEDVKILDTPVARRAYEKSQADLSAAEEALVKADRSNQTLTKWYNDEALPAYKRMEKDLLTARANDARSREVIRAAVDQGIDGLAEVAKDMGYDVEDANKGARGKPGTPRQDEPAPIDTSKFLTDDKVIPLLDRAGDGLAILQDIVMEHAQLFPDKPLRVRELRREALAAGKTIEEHWLAKYAVPAARTERERKTQEAYDNNLIQQGRKAAEAEFASKYGDPNVRPAVPSTSILTPRPKDGRDKQPWETNTDAENGSRSRVERAVKTQVTAPN